MIKVDDDSYPNTSMMQELVRELDEKDSNFFGFVINKRK